jgi:hypothetical protein
MWRVVTGQTIKQDGTPAVSDADLGVVNVTLMATIQSAAKIPSLTIDPNYISSFIGIPDWLAASRGISYAIGLLGVNPAALKDGTTVMVTFSDGTSAQFTKACTYCTTMWVYKPGTAKNKDGKFIDTSGKVIGNSINNLNLGKLLASLPSFGGNGLSPGDWFFWDPLPNGIVIVGPISDP